MLKLSWLLLLGTLVAIHSLRIQPGVRWLQRNSLKPKPINLPASTRTKVVPGPTFQNSNSHKISIPVLLANTLTCRKPVVEQQPILSQANAIEMFKARTPYAIWNSTLDGLLEQGVALFSANDKLCWENTAKLIGHGMSWTQCRQRWQRYLKDKDVYSRDGEEWTDSELATINELAEAQRSRSNSFWKSVGLQLQRNPHRCRDVWERSKETSKGRYTAEEDALILQHVKEQNRKGPGLWATLGRELDRPARTVRAHWLEMSAVKDKKNTVVWSEKMDEAFLSTRPDTDQPKPFLRVAHRMQVMGYPVTERQCTARWHHHLRWKQLGYRTEDVAWTPEEVSLLNKLQTDGNSWTDIAHALQVSPRQCQYKWTEAPRECMKQGPFTPAEDALIRQKVAAQDCALSRTQTKGFWMDLEREMGRYHTSIRTRWIRTLFHKIL